MTTERPDRGAPRTKAGRMLLMAGLTFHSGRRLADAPELVAAIEEEAAGLPDAAELERLRRIVKRAAGMGLCSQTHHEHLMIAARAALEPEGSAPEPRVVQHPVTGWTVEATAEDDVDAARMLDDLEPEGGAQG